MENNTTIKSRIYISALGVRTYAPSTYFQGETIFAETRYVQIATMRLWKCNEWKPENNDRIILLVTDGAKEKCLDDHEDRDGNAVDGLMTEMLRLGIDEKIIKPIYIADGSTKEEIMNIFMQINEDVAKTAGAELYCDVTYGLRYLPMLLVVFNNYSRFINNTRCKEIAYGSFETPKDGKSPIISLNWLDEIQQWTTAAENIITSGNAERLAEITTLQNRIARRDKNKIARKLEDVTKELQTCRGSKLIEGKTIKILLRQIDTDKEDDMAKPFIPILDKIKNDFLQFNGNGGWQNGLYGAKWCCEHNMYQQAITLLRETGITHFCMELGLNWQAEDDRDKVYPIVRSLCKRSDGTNTKPNDAEIIKHAEFVRNDSRLCQWVDVLDECTNLRNNYNHAGMLKSQKDDKAGIIIKNIQKLVDKACAIDAFEGNADIIDVTSSPTLFVNLSNHPSAKWTDEQLQSARIYGDVVDLPFPQVSPDATPLAVKDIAVETIGKVEKLTSGNTDSVIHVMGEMSLTFSLVNGLQRLGYRCVCSTTERMVAENPDGSKTVLFHFNQFRDYE